MSVDRINGQLYVNVYNSNSSKSIEKLNRTKANDVIEISSLGRSLIDYYHDNNLDNVKKVAQIKRQVESGTYSVDARLTAKSLLNAMKEN